jgi:hypothetical protein
MSDSQSTHTMISALTADLSQGEGIGEDELMVLGVVQLVPSPALNSVFDCHNLEVCIVGGKCDKTFSPVHATRALKHLMKIKK